MSDSLRTQLKDNDELRFDFGVNKMKEQAYVWDKFVRLFHWLLVILFVVSYLSAEEVQVVHTYSGYTIFCLVMSRCLWGFLGSRHARFSDFVYAPGKTISYLKSMASGNPKRYLGHNPAGGVMVVAILITLSMTTLSGMKLLAIEEGEGPFADVNVSLAKAAYADEDEYEHNAKEDDHEEKEEFWEEIHEFFVNLMLLLIVIHIVGVFLASRQHGESLVKAMVTGYKDRE